MIKKTHWLIIAGLILLTGDVLVANDTKPCICNTPKYTTTKKVIIGSLVLVGAIGIGIGVYLLGPGAATHVKEAFDKASPYVNKAKDIAVPKTTVGKVGYGLTAVQVARPYVVQTNEEKLKNLAQEKATRKAKASEDFVGCLIANKSNSPRNNTGIPIACEEAALVYALNSNIAELNKKTEAFKNGKCFCDGRL